MSGHKMFKYASSAHMEKIFAKDGFISFRCSRPNEFNDPYELFLTIDRNCEPELLAFYSDAVGEIPQLPTTCFSRSPAIVPMWAHYAQNASGFVVEIDEDSLHEAFPRKMVGNVEYRDSADDQVQYVLRMAYTTCKPRHTYSLHRAVLHASYFTKMAFWEYELERRLVVLETDVRKAGDIELLDIPWDAVTRIVVGPSATESTKAFLREAAEKIGCPYLDFEISRISVIPHFRDQEGKVWRFEEGSFHPVPDLCEKCREPVSEEHDLCSFCLIQEADRVDAAKRNPYRILDHYGMLEGYISAKNKGSSE